MVKSDTLTIRIDGELKRELEAAASAEDRTVTDFVVRAIRERIVPQCATCGRTSHALALPAGFTPAFDAFLKEVQKASKGQIPVCLTTLEAGSQRVYWGRIRFWNEEHRGSVTLDVEAGPGTALVRVPRGVLTGWEFDQEQRHRQTYMRLGYFNANALVERDCH